MDIIKYIKTLMTDIYYCIKYLLNGGLSELISHKLEEDLKNIKERRMNDLRHIEEVRMEDLRCYTLHFYYRIKGTDLFNGNDGFVTATMEESTKHINDITISKFNEFSDSYRKIIAHKCNTSTENVIPISRDEYYENVKESKDE